MACPWAFLWIIPLFSTGVLLIVCILEALFLLLSGGTDKDLENSDLKSENPFYPTRKSRSSYEVSLEL